MISKEDLEKLFSYFYSQSYTQPWVLTQAVWFFTTCHLGLRSNSREVDRVTWRMLVSSFKFSFRIKGQEQLHSPALKRGWWFIYDQEPGVDRGFMPAQRSGKCVCVTSRSCMNVFIVFLVFTLRASQSDVMERNRSEITVFECSCPFNWGWNVLIASSVWLRSGYENCLEIFLLLRNSLHRSQRGQNLPGVCTDHTCRAKQTNRWSTACWFSLTSLHILHVWWSYRGSRALGTNFHFLSVFVVSEKKIHGPGRRQTQRECPGKLRAKSTKVWTKKIGRFRSGGEHSPVRAHTSTRSRSWACRNYKTLTNLWRSKGLWRWVLLSNVRTVSLPCLL